MKKLIIAATVLSVAAVGTQTVKAGDCTWNTAGLVLAGVAAGAVVASAANCNNGNVSVSYSYNTAPVCPPPAPVVYAPARVVYVPAPVYYVSRPVVYAQPVVAYRPAACALPVRYYQPYAPRGRGNGNHYGQQYARR